MYTAVTLAAAVLAAAGAVAAPPQAVEPRATLEKRGSVAVPLNPPRALPRDASQSDIIEHLREMSIGTRKKYLNHLSPEGKRHLKRDLAIRDEMLRKRAAGDLGTTTLANTGIDSSYSAAVEIGTPPQSLLVVMDTGSSDLWVVDTSCSVCAQEGLPLFDETKSSTVRRSNMPFGVKYGSGEVSGSLGTDTVSMAGFTINRQYFGLVDQAIGTQPGSSKTTALLNAPLSGIMGLAFTGLVAAPEVVPWWEQLAQSTWKDPEFGVFMKRYRGQADTRAFEPNGGEIVFGGLNTSMFQGKMNYVNVPGSNDYWRIPVDDISLGGKSLGYNNPSPNAAIDTGTTLIGAPSSVVRAIYSSIRGSQELSQYGMEGYYAYPCATTVDFAMTFGGVSYPVNNDDFNFNQLDDTYCIGAVFALDTGSNSLVQWIVGATFLKNVYSAYRLKPAAVGFASLANGVQVAGNDLTQGGNINPLGNGGSGHIPSGVTIGNPQNTGSSNPLGNSGSGAFGLRAPTAAVIVATLLAAFL